MMNVFIGYCAGVMVITLIVLIIVYKFETKGKSK
jgi:tetrahydromethanopterin S-methyltransferase subunit B